MLVCRCKRLAQSTAVPHRKVCSIDYWTKILKKRKSSNQCDVDSKHTSTTISLFNAQPCNLWAQYLIHYSGNMGLNRFPALTPQLSPASSSSQINIPAAVQRARPHEPVFRGIWQNSPHLSRFRISHKHTLIPKSQLSLFQFQTAGREPAQTLMQAGCWIDHL